MIVLYLFSEGNFGFREVKTMKTMPRPTTTTKRTTTPAIGKATRILRRAGNHNAHVITHHGHVLIGRKGRTGAKAERP